MMTIDHYPSGLSNCTLIAAEQLGEAEPTLLDAVAHLGAVAHLDAAANVRANKQFQLHIIIHKYNILYSHKLAAH